MVSTNNTNNTKDDDDIETGKVYGLNRVTKKKPKPIVKSKPITKSKPNDSNPNSYEKEMSNPIGKIIELYDPDIDRVGSQFTEHDITMTNESVDSLVRLMFADKVSITSAENIIKKLSNPDDLESRLRRTTQIYRESSEDIKKTNTNDDKQNQDKAIDTFISTLIGQMENPREFVVSVSKTWRRYRFLKGIDYEILKELAGHTFERISDKPLLVIGNNNTKQISQAWIKYVKMPSDEYDDPEGAHCEPVLKYKDIIINAIPKKITRYENPANSEMKYDIDFETPLGQIFKTEPLSLAEIADFLKSKGLVYKMRAVDETLAQILQAYDRDGKVNVVHDIEASGFYLIDGKIECFGFQFKKPTADEMKECAKLMNTLVVDKYNNDNRLPTILKWFINAPFDYIRKSFKTWMPWNYLNGIPSTTKNTRCDVGMAMWRIHYTHDDPINPKYNLTFAHIDSVAKLGKIMSSTTMPILVSEVGGLSDLRKYGHLVEMMKGCVEFPTCRAAHDRKGRYQKKPARAILAMTGNGMPPVDGGFLSRIIDMLFTGKDQHPRHTPKSDEFQAWLMSELDRMGALGDFTYYYIKENQGLLKKTWNDAGKEILTKFYEAAGEKVPEWINLILETNPLQDATDRTLLLVREYFVELTNYTYSRISKRDDLSGIAQKLEICCRNNMIAFIQFNAKNDLYYITRGIIDDMKGKKNNLDGLVGNLQGLAHMMSFECTTSKVMGKSMYSISVPAAQMKDLLESKVEVEEDEKKKTTTQTTLPVQPDDDEEDGLDEFIKEEKEKAKVAKAAAAA
ncbi:MAG: hypothetical protein ACHQ1D_03260 [Nitrososphaerales archaeon]